MPCTCGQYACIMQDRLPWVVSVLCMLVQLLLWFLVPALVASWQATAYGRKQL